MATGTWGKDRKADRANFDAELRVLVPESGEVRGYCRDLSSHGLGAHLVTALPPGQAVTLEFELDSSGKVQAQARVVHRVGLRHGFEFVQPLGRVNIATA